MIEPHEEESNKQKSSHVDAKKYTMEIKWSDVDNAYIVTVPELPGCRTHGEAFQRGIEAIESWIEASQAWGDPIPPPGELTAVYV